MKIQNLMGSLALFFCFSSNAADLDRASVQSQLATATSTQPADLRRKDLTDLDLSGLDFSHADLWG